VERPAVFFGRGDYTGILYYEDGSMVSSRHHFAINGRSSLIDASSRVYTWRGHQHFLVRYETLSPVGFEVAPDPNPPQHTQPNYVYPSHISSYGGKAPLATIGERLTDVGDTVALWPPSASLAVG
jgi:hypothetical protein